MDRTSALKLRIETLARRARSFATDGVTVPLALGYGCYRGANSLIYSTTLASGGTPVLFIGNFDFALASGVLSTLAALLTAWVAFRRQGSLRLPVVLPAALLAALQALSLSGVLGTLPPRWEMLASSAVYAAATTVFGLAWIVEFARHGVIRAACIYALGAFVLSLANVFTRGLGSVAQAVCGIALLAVAATVLLLARRSSADPEPVVPRSDMTLRDVGRELAYLVNPIATMVVLESAVSLLNGFFLGHSLFSDGSALFSAGSLAGAAYVLAATFSTPRSPDIRRTFRQLFPLLTATVVLLPFAGEGQNDLLGGALGLFYNVINIWTMCLVLAHVSSKRLDAAVIVGCTTALGRLSHVVFIPLGNALGGFARGGMGQIYFGVALLVIYALAMLLMYLSRPSRRAEAAPAEAAAGGAAPGPEPSRQSPAEADADFFATRADELAERHRLTPREREIALLLARGRSAVFIAEDLSCSPATVRSHAKNIYTKLDVHSKQELIDLFANGDGAAREG